VPPKSIMNTVRDIAKELSNGRCVLFLGSGVSAGVPDHPGLPTSNELPDRALEEIDSTRAWTLPLPSLTEVLTLLERRKGRRCLEDFLVKEIEAHPDPLPAHFHIARLPLTDVITTNWDELLERALDLGGVPYCPILNDEKVPDASPGAVRLVKCHGTISQREKLVATLEDTLDLFHEKPLLSALVRSLCAPKTVLFLGYSLDDVDFLALLRQLRRELGKYQHPSYAVQKKSSPRAQAEAAALGIRLIHADLTEFLELLGFEILYQEYSTFRRGDMRDPLKRRILLAGTRPCGPKSPAPFQNAKKIVRPLSAHGRVRQCVMQPLPVAADLPKGIKSFNPCFDLVNAKVGSFTLITEKTVIEVTQAR